MKLQVTQCVPLLKYPRGEGWRVYWVEEGHSLRGVRKDLGGLEGNQALAVGVGKEGSNKRWRK